MLGYAALTRRTTPRRLAQYARARIVQWAIYLVKTKNPKLTIRRAPPGAQAAFFSDTSTLNGPSPGSSYGGACQQFSTGDPTQGVPVMSGALWARSLVPRTLGDSSAAVELVMSTIAVKEAMARRIQAEELRQGAHGPSRLYPGATATGRCPTRPRGG